MLDMRQPETSSPCLWHRTRRIEEVRAFRPSVAPLSSARPGEKNRSRHTWSILLSKLSSALFYTLFGVMGTDSVLDCGMTYRLAVARTFLKPPRKNGDQHFPLGFLLWIPRVSSDEAIRGYCRIPSACLRLRSGGGWRIKRPSSERLWPITRCFPSRPWCWCS